MKKINCLCIVIILIAGLLTGCGGAADRQHPASDGTVPDAGAEAASMEEQTASGESEDNKNAGSDKVASADEMADPVDVVEEGMAPVYADALVEGSYEVVVDSSSSMFKVIGCELTVKDGAMTAVMTMGGTGYLQVFMGTGEQAAAASEDAYIPFVENERGEHTFTVPVEALDAGIECSAFSKKKEKWYDRILVFRADSLPMEAWGKGAVTSAADLGLKAGTYTVSVVLEGGSGKASVEPLAKLTVVDDGSITATLVWSSDNYDYMVVDGEKYLPVSTEGGAVFEIPVLGFDYKMPVTADTTAMSTPHEIDYTLYFDSGTIKEDDR
ncbi:MAG: hypothetical protein K2G89_00745 [Lachnospiraceae bacterium]|nr:hypothetical protein [Lachnospiraceae bacterium]